MSTKPKLFQVTRTPKGLDQILALKPDLAALHYCAVVNVADSPCATFDYQLKVPSFWFPINEIGHWGHSSFFGLMKIVNQYFRGDKPILIHCHAGANRSPSHAYAILLAKGFTPKEAEESLNYPDLSLVFKRNVDRKHIPHNIIEFLKAVDTYPDESLYGVLRKMDAEYEVWSQRKFGEQNDCVVSVDAQEGVRLVYNKEKKKFIVTSNSEIIKHEPWVDPRFEAADWKATPIVPKNV